MGNRSFTRRFPHVKFVAVSHTILTDPRTRAAYAEAAGIYRIVPAGVAIAEDVTELVALMQWAAGTRTPLIRRGGDLFRSERCGKALWSPASARPLICTVRHVWRHGRHKRRRAPHGAVWN